MGHLRFELYLGGRRTVIEREWEEIRYMQDAEPTQTVNVIAEISASVQRLLDGSRLPADPPMRATITKADR